MIDYREDNRWTVYIHIVPKEVSGKLWDKYYVGITSQDIHKRWGYNGCNYKNLYFYNAVKKYHWNNIQYEIIANNLTHDEANKLEISLIKALKSNDKKYGYNISSGGDGGNKKEVIPVKQYDTKGNFICEYSSAAEAARILGFDRTHITRCCKHGGTTHGYMFSYINDLREPFKRITQKNILQFTLNNEFVTEYNSIDEASKITGINKHSISKCLSHDNKSGKGFIWFYKDEYENLKKI